LRKNRKNEELVQVTYRLDEKTEERELRSLCEAGEELNCNNLQVVTWDQEGEVKSGEKHVKYLPFWKWALRPTEQG
jgi:predicted AAA+ superfamily ATPase